MDDVEYRGLIAEAWDALRGDTSDWEDRVFFLDLIRERGAPVLDVGCGTGRLLLDYLSSGLDVDGVDNSPEMLCLCRSKAAAMGLIERLRVYEQQMERLKLPRRYRTIMVPSSSFQLVLDPALAVQTMRRFFAHLEPDGTLAMPFLVMAEAYEEHWTKEATLPDGTTVRRTAGAWYDPATQLERTDDIYDVVRDGEVVRSERHVRSPATRAYTRSQAVALHEAAGFVDVEVLSNFTREPTKPDDWVFTVVARRPA